MAEVKRKKKAAPQGWAPPKDLPDLRDAKMIAVDTEGADEALDKGMGPGGVLGMAEVYGLSVAVDGWKGYIPLRHPDTDNFDHARVARWCKDNLCRPHQVKVGANLMYDLENMSCDGLPISGKFMDVQHAEPLLNENKSRFGSDDDGYGLDSLTRAYLPPEFHKSGEALRQRAEAYLGKTIKDDPRKYIRHLPASLVGEYAEDDAVGTLMVIKEQLPRIEREELTQVFDLECRLIPLLLAIRLRGVPVDMNRVERVGEDLGKQIKKMSAKLKSIAGEEVNVNASRSLAKLFDANNIPYPHTVKTGAASFTKEFLAACDWPVAQEVLRLKKMKKWQGTFLDGAITKFFRDGRLYYNLNQLRGDENGTVSGRFSSSKPNLQQIPGDTDPEAGEIIRSLFIPEDGEEWWKNDYSQIEYRMIVHYAASLGLPKADVARERYQSDPNTDFHSWVAEMCGIPRRPAKNINFGLAYGMGIKKLMASLGVSLEEAKQIMDMYLEEVPFVKQLAQRVARTASGRGFIKTILGRRRRFDLYEPTKNFGEGKRPALPKDQAIQEYGRNIQVAHVHKAMNALIQGSAADQMKKAMVEIWESGMCSVLGVPYLTVHDELDGSKPKGKKGDKALKEVVRIMESCVELSVPVLVDCGVGKDWWHVNKISK